MQRAAQWGIGICLAIFISFSGDVSAEFYKYVDKDGNVRFTDDLGKIPSEQRREIEEYETFEPAPERVSPPKDDAAEVVPGDDENESDEVSPTQEDRKDRPEKDPLGMALDQEGKQLQEEYETLMKEKARLEELASRRLTPSARRALEKDIKDFNARIKAYDKKREAHNRAVEDYNISTQ